MRFSLNKALPLVALLVGAAILGASTQARADFQVILRGTEYNSSGVAEFTSSTTFTSPTSPFSGNVTLSVGDFNITMISNITNTGSGSTKHSSTINLNYTGTTGSNSDSLLVEVLGSNYVSPSVGPAVISSNGSPSTTGLSANSLTMTSGVINTDPTSLTTVTAGTTTLAGTPLGSQLGMTTGTGSMGAASSVLQPNPAGGSVFTIANPFAFYQTYTFSGFTTTNDSGSFSSGSTVSTVPAPASLLLLLTGLPALGGYSWLRRRKAVQPA